MNKHKFEKLYTLAGTEKTPIGRSWIDFFHKNNLPVITIGDESEIQPGESKKNFLLTSRKGGFVNPCPCTPGAVRCGYQNINLIEGCPFYCNYCALDVYLKSTVTKVFVNTDDFEKELDQYLAKISFVRIGTGELTDSMVWEPVFSYADYLMDVFQKYPHAVLEFKTKSAEVENFLKKPAPSNVLLSWSVNSVQKIAEEERGVASLKERLEAAQKAADHGYKVGFHFDPIYHYPGWEEGYRETVDAIFSRIDPASIGWISLGVIRFAPSLMEELYRRNTGITRMEMFPAHYDGKMRVFYPLRNQILNFIAGEIRKYTHKFYLCMEPTFMWEKVALPYEKANLKIYENFFTN